RVDPPAVGLLHPYRWLDGASGRGAQRAGELRLVHWYGLPRSAVPELGVRTGRNDAVVPAPARAGGGTRRAGRTTLLGRAGVDAGRGRRDPHRRRAGSAGVPSTAGHLPPSRY